MRLAAAVTVGFVLAQAGLLSAAQPVSRPGHDPYAASSVPSSTYAGHEGPHYDAPIHGGSHQEWVHPRCCCPTCKLHHGLPYPHKSRCDMPQHIPYLAEPKFYYYFRPYNWFHIPVQQDDVQAFGGDPRHPYDNRIFQSVYGNLHFDTPPEHVAPPEAPSASAPRTTVKARAVSKPEATRPNSKPTSTVRIRSVSSQPKK